MHDLQDSLVVYGFKKKGPIISFRSSPGKLGRRIIIGKPNGNRIVSVVQVVLGRPVAVLRVTKSMADIENFQSRMRHFSAYITRNKQFYVLKIICISH